MLILQTDCKKVNTFIMQHTTNKAPMAHLCILMATVIWGLQSPFGKDAMTHGIDGYDMIAFRAAGGAALFWLTSLFVKREKICWRDRLKLIGAGLLGLVFNQCCFTIGLSITSPVNASIVTTSLPIFALVLAAVILKEPVTGMKAGGVLIGCSGAVMLIVSSAVASSAKVGNIWGDLLCMGAQFSFALYLALYCNLIRRYHAVTINKWMFLWSAMFVVPFSSGHLLATDWAAVPMKSWFEAGFVVLFSTYVAYLLVMQAQAVLRPTVVSIYNYIQPVVAVAVSIVMGMSVLTWQQGLAAVLIFSGVGLVIKSKSRRDMAAQKS